MKCPKCKKDNKEKAGSCRFCGTALDGRWMPSWRWNLRVLAVIYGVLVVLFILSRIFL